MAYKMNYKIDIKNLIRDLRGPKGTAALTEEFEKIKSEVQKLGKMVRPRAEKRLLVAQTRLRNLLSQFEKRQDQMEKDLQKTFRNIRSMARDTESRLQTALHKAGLSKTKTTAKPTAKRSAKKATKKTRTKR
jgi:hypothetical protein